MNEKIYNIQMKIEEKLNKTSNERLKNEYKEILNEENEIKKLSDDENILKIEAIEYKKIKYYAKLELFYEHICEDYIVLIEDLNESINNNSYNEEELTNIIEKIRQKIENDEELSLSEYKQIRAEIDTLLLQINEKNSGVKPETAEIIVKQEKPQLIKPYKSILKKFITPKDFYEQFGFYPISRGECDDRLKLYDLSYIDYSNEDLTYANFEGTNFSFNLELLKNKDIRYSNFKNTNVKVKNLDKFNFNCTNFEGTNLNKTTLNINGTSEKNLLYSIDISKCPNQAGGIYRANFKNTGINIYLHGFVYLDGCNLERCSVISDSPIDYIIGSNLKDTGIVIDLENVAKKKYRMVHGDYRGCRFENLYYFDKIDKSDSKFDEAILTADTSTCMKVKTINLPRLFSKH